MPHLRALTLRQLVHFVRDTELRRFLLFLVVGGVNFAFSYSVFAGLHLLGVHHSTAAVASWVAGVLFNFGTTGRIVFGTGNVRLLPRFVGVYLVQLALNLFFLDALIDLGISPLIAQAVVVGGLAVLTFLALRAFVFSRVIRRTLADPRPAPIVAGAQEDPA